MRNTAPPDTLDRRLPATLGGVILPPIVWTLFFVSIYGAQGAGCASGLAEDGVLQYVLVAIAGATALILAGIGGWSWRVWRGLKQAAGPYSAAYGRAVFCAGGTLMEAALFLLATIWISLPTLTLDPCVGHMLNA